jgi:hypothetical protein
MMQYEIRMKCLYTISKPEANADGLREFNYHLLFDFVFVLKSDYSRPIFDENHSIMHKTVSAINSKGDEMGRRKL